MRLCKHGCGRPARVAGHRQYAQCNPCANARYRYKFTGGHRTHGICEICGDTAKLVIDHCHKEGHVRGHICGACNTQLLPLMDSGKDVVALVYRAMEYIGKKGK